MKQRIIYIFILFFLAVTFVTDTPPPPSGWYQQFMPTSLGNRQIMDIIFLDSLNGYAVASQTSDSSFILKTTNGGDNWQIIYGQNPYMTQLQFLNLNTGYTCGSYIYKTTNGGLNWSQLNMPAVTADGMNVWNQDTIWFVGSDPLTGGVFRTTNGGVNWEQQFSGGANNPARIYMYNQDTGFITDNSGTYLRKTANGGGSWNVITGASGFTDIYFVNSLTGWRAFGTMRKTTDGGLNWVTQTLPSGGSIITSGVNKFSNINIDTIWGVGGYISTNLGLRGLLYRTTNRGDNWLFQVPDTNINIFQYYHNQFITRTIGWAYSGTSGIHTLTGGDTVWYTGIQQTPNAVPEGFVLKQNYPNPFNPRTVIPYSLSAPAHVKIIAYDITGREVQRMVDQYQQAGAYEVDFMGKFTASGVYFYRMSVMDEKSNLIYTNTKKMILLK